MDETRVFGVDEAGRGPVFGSMFIACVSAPESALPTEVKDSKQLSESTRTGLAQRIYGQGDIRTTVIEVSPETIDDADDGITALTATQMANAIQNTVKGDERGYVDACHPDESVFEEMVKNGLGSETSIQTSAEHKADESYPIVSAASIIAKDSRERHVEALQNEHGSIGSGYPSDPTTRRYLSEYVSEHGHPPPFARESWNTVRDALEGEL